MSPLRFRPELRVPWQAIVAFAVLAYVLRSALRAWDFVPDVLDLVVFGGLALILIVRPLVARMMIDDDGHEEPPLQ
jgi:hypothetical protein